ncbi:MAG: class I SAM-dependent methyltransferase [Acidobacteria bacterium]|nr:class I SAM-dependent methyltransferase [Acidobacteriota bacterium]
MEMDRSSNGLRQFFENLPHESRMRILDLGGASQANINIIALQGHKLYTEDLLVGLERLHATAREQEQRANPAARFIRENLHFPPAQFDGILVWDTLEFLEEELLPPVVSQLHAILKPGGTLLTFFHTLAKGETVHVCRYQIRDHQTLRLQPRLSRPLPRAFNNRSLERLFANFHSVKFFLAKDNLREVIVTR